MSVDQIVTKLAGPAQAAGEATSLRETQNRELRVRVSAESRERMRKQATVTLEAPPGSTWSIACDEGAYLAGDDTAPPPLVYFAAAVAF